jgi:hypothetical protein
MKKIYSAPVIRSIELESELFMTMSNTKVDGVDVIQTDFYDEDTDLLDSEGDFL